MKNQLYSLLIRWYATNDSQLPQWLFTACQRDQSLWKLYELENKLSESLSQSSGNKNHEGVRPELTEKILAAIREESLTITSHPEKRNHFKRNWKLGIAFAGVSGLTALIVLSVLSTVTMDENSIELAVSAQTPTTLVSDDLFETPKDWENPLDREIDNVIADARGAFGFLASNFLPSGITEELLETESQGDA